MASGFWDLAQICRNGHVTNAYTRSAPEDNQNFCERCGASTQTEYQNCHQPIRGDYYSPTTYGVSSYEAPPFCRECGKPFPWTECKLAAAKEFAGSIDALNEAEQDELKASLDDLVRETPRTPVAQSKFRAFMKKAGKETAEGMRSIIVDIVSEAVKKSLFP